MKYFSYIFIGEPSYVHVLIWRIQNVWTLFLFLFTFLSPTYLSIYLVELYMKKATVQVGKDWQRLIFLTLKSHSMYDLKYLTTQQRFGLLVFFSRSIFRDQSADYELDLNLVINTADLFGIKLKVCRKCWHTVTIKWPGKSYTFSSGIALSFKAEVV